MKMMSARTGIFAAALLALTGCGGGGTTDNLPTENEAATAVDSTVSDAVTDVDNAVADVANSVDEAGWSQLQGNWQDSIAGIKDQWSELTEEELLQVNGDREGLVSLVQDKYGLDRDTAESQVDEWASQMQ